MFNPFAEPDDIEVQLDLTPLIDVVFMLIIFFFLAGTFTKPMLELLLPHAKTSEVNNAARERELTVQIDADGSIHHDGQIYREDDIASLVALEPERRMNLHVDARAPFAAFIKVVDEARAVGRDNIVITTRKE